ncbi:unnamed protein product [Linum trigynum]|uniref:Uncharacterized protein n=1 Tax=Linum trigynum TaxID=586398 RepID=A0AAV2FUQ4_9ROSI
MSHLTIPSCSLLPTRHHLYPHLTPLIGEDLPSLVLYFLFNFSGTPLSTPNSSAHLTTMNFTIFSKLAWTVGEPRRSGGFSKLSTVWTNETESLVSPDDAEDPRRSCLNLDCGLS